MRKLEIQTVPSITIHGYVITSIPPLGQLYLFAHLGHAVSMKRSHEYTRQLADMPIFDCEQPDGSRHTIDMTEPGVFGDFVFRDQSAERRETGLYSAYHTGTGALFTYMLTASLRAETPAENMAALRRELERTTLHHTFTEQSQSSFSEYALAAIRTLDAAELPPLGLRASDIPNDMLQLSPTDTGIEFTMSRPWDDEVLTYAIEIPYGDCWKFIAGMVWRSYGDDRPFPELSRHSSATYYAALTAFTEGHTL